MTFNDFLPKGWSLLYADFEGPDGYIILSNNKHMVSGQGVTFDEAFRSALLKVMKEYGGVPNCPYFTKGVTLNQVLPKGFILQSINIGPQTDDLCFDKPYSVRLHGLYDNAEPYGGWVVSGDTLEEAFLEAFELINDIKAYDF